MHLRTVDKNRAYRFLFKRREVIFIKTMHRHNLGTSSYSSIKPRVSFSFYLGVNFLCFSILRLLLMRLSNPGKTVYGFHMAVSVRLA